jgi:hypothetical protein
MARQDRAAAAAFLCENNLVEQDHRFIKRRVNAVLGFFSFKTARMNMIRKAGAMERTGATSCSIDSSPFPHYIVAAFGERPRPHGPLGKRESGANPELPRSGKQERRSSSSTGRKRREATISRIKEHACKSEDLPKTCVIDAVIA